MSPSLPTSRRSSCAIPGGTGGPISIRVEGARRLRLRRVPGCDALRNPATLLFALPKSMPCMMLAGHAQIAEVGPWASASGIALSDRDTLHRRRDLFHTSGASKGWPAWLRWAPPRRNLVATILPNEASLLRLASSGPTEISIDWETEPACLAMEVR